MGRNIALPNSFSLDMTNNSSSTFTFNLFNLGGALQTQITTQQNLSTILDYDFSSFLIPLSSQVSANTTFEVFDSSFNLLSTTSLLSGQNINLVASGMNPVVGTNGLTGTFQLDQHPSPNNKLINVSVGNANATYFRVFQTSAPFNTILLTFQQTIASFVTNNPLVTLGGTIPFNEILNSETGNAYKIDGIDIISNNSQQLTEDVEYGFKDANGDKVRLSSTNYVDVYQPQSTSLQNILTPGFVIDSETLFTYTVLSYTFVRITFNYVRAQLSIMKQFDQAIAQEFVYESNKLYNQLQVTDSKRYILYQ